MISPARSKAAPPGTEGRKRGPDGPHPLGPLTENLAELREFAVYYFGLRLDAVKSSIRRAMLMAVVGVVGLLAAAAGLTTAVVFVLLGSARGLAVLLGGRAWAADLIVGAAVILLAAGALLLTASLLSRSSRQRTVEKYERQRSAQRARFGHDVSGPMATG